jgi:hypothetical protein
MSNLAPRIFSMNESSTVNQKLEIKPKEDFLSGKSPEKRAIHVYFMRMSAHHLGLDLPEKYEKILDPDS